VSCNRVSWNTRLTRLLSQSTMLRRELSELWSVDHPVPVSRACDSESRRIGQDLASSCIASWAVGSSSEVASLAAVRILNHIKWSDELMFPDGTCRFNDDGISIDRWDEGEDEEGNGGEDTGFVR
jgi:hypothetical protein